MRPLTKAALEALDDGRSPLAITAELRQLADALEGFARLLLGRRDGVRASEALTALVEDRQAGLVDQARQATADGRDDEAHRLLGEATVLGVNLAALRSEARLSARWN